MIWQAHIIFALILDSLLGDPPNWPHPVKMIGRLAGFSEGLTRKNLGPTKAAGLVTVLIVLAITGAVVFGAVALAGLLHPGIQAGVAVIFLYTAFAGRDLAIHSRRVHAALAADDLPEARRRVGMMVGRDTTNLTREEVTRACVESVAENMVDGVTAPLFYAFIGGPVGALLYKAVNTMDSMFGYKNERYRQFGWAAARLDDAANFLPARLTGLLIVLAAFLGRFAWQKSWAVFLRDRLRHASPNSGHSEAAVAGALGLRLGGPAVYFGQPVTKPTIGNGEKTIEPAHILETNRLLTLTVVLTVLIYWGISILGKRLLTLLF